MIAPRFRYRSQLPPLAAGLPNAVCEAPGCRWLVRAVLRKDGDGGARLRGPGGSWWVVVLYEVPPHRAPRRHRHQGSARFLPSYETPAPEVT